MQPSLSIGGKDEEVLALYNRALLQIDDHHPGALFVWLWKGDRRGSDMKLWALERAASCFPAHIGTLINLGIIYEDRNDYNRAQACYKRVLDVYPGHARARLYLKDASLPAM